MRASTGESIKEGTAGAFIELCNFIKELYPGKDFIPLHEPRFVGNERKYVADALDSTFVSSVGKYVDQFEDVVRDYTGAKYAVATVNGTAALHISLLLAGVKKGDLVITQPFSFIATCNAISYVGAEPLFVDIDLNTLGLSAEALSEFLKAETFTKSGETYHKATGKRIVACVPMHSFGHPVEIDKITGLCNQFNIALVEDAAESLGSTFQGKQTGTFGKLGTYSFNGNKTITSGGGGVIVTNDSNFGKRAKHLTTQAKLPHKWNFEHDEIGYNYRMPNINAALACAQMELLNDFIENKRQVAEKYKMYFKAQKDFTFVSEPVHSKSNYWLNAVLCEDREQRDALLTYTNEHGVMSRPAWQLMHRLEMFKNCPRQSLINAEWVEARLVNLPSSVQIL